MLLALRGGEEKKPVVVDGCRRVVASNCLLGWLTGKGWMVWLARFGVRKEEEEEACWKDERDFQEGREFFLLWRRSQLQRDPEKEDDAKGGRRGVSDSPPIPQKPTRGKKKNQEMASTAITTIRTGS